MQPLCQQVSGSSLARKFCSVGREMCRHVSLQRKKDLVAGKHLLESWLVESWLAWVLACMQARSLFLSKVRRTCEVTTHPTWGKKEKNLVSRIRQVESWVVDVKKACHMYKRERHICVCLHICEKVLHLCEGCVLHSGLLHSFRSNVTLCRCPPTDKGIHTDARMDVYMYIFTFILEYTYMYIIICM